MRYIPHKLPCVKKGSEYIGQLDPLIARRANVVFERSEHEASILAWRSP